MSLPCWINYISTILFVFYTYLFGMDYLTVDSPAGTFAVVLFLAFVIIPIFNATNLEFSIKLLMIFLLGIFIYVTFVVINTLMTIPIEFGMKSLVSPFFPDLVFNTPSFSNYLAVVFCGFLYPALVGKGLIVKYISYLILALSFLMAISLGGRTFFLITLIFIAACSLNLGAKKIYLILSLFSITVSVLVYYLHTEYPSFSEVLILKFNDGLASSRYEHWQDALQKIPTHPFGGFDVNQQIEEIHSFHNILFDAARLSGWFSILLLLIIIFINVIIYFYIKKSDVTLYYLWYFSFIVALVMMQDVILEGTYKYIVLYTLLNHIIIKSVKRNISTTVKINKLLYE